MEPPARKPIRGRATCLRDQWSVWFCLDPEPWLSWLEWNHLRSFINIFSVNSLSPLVHVTLFPSPVRCVLVNPSQQIVIQQGLPQIFLNLKRAEVMKWREWQFSHPCRYKNFADREAIVVGRREPTEEVAVKTFEMSVRGANGKVNYRSGQVYWCAGFEAQAGVSSLSTCSAVGSQARPPWRATLYQHATPLYGSK